MQQYILILLGVLVILLIGVIYFGWRKLMNLEIEASRNKYDIEALRSLLSKILEGDEPPTFQELQSLQSKQINNAQKLEKMQTQINSPFQQQFPVQQNNIPQQKYEEESLESDVDTLESTEDKVPEDEESSVSIESLGSTEEEGEDISDDSEEESEEEASEESEEEESEVDEEEEDSDDEAQKLIESELALDDAEDDVKVEVNGDKGDEPEEKNEEETVEEDVKNVQVGDMKKRNKKVPNEAAKDFRVGYRMKSTNDGNTYEVVKNGNRKSWKLV